MMRNRKLWFGGWMLALLVLAMLGTVTAQEEDLAEQIYLPLVSSSAEGMDAEPPLVEATAEPEEPVAEPPAPEDGEPPPVDPAAHLQDGDAELPAGWEVAPAAVAAFDATTWRVQDRLGVGTDAPAYRVDVRQTTNGAARMYLLNSSAGTAARAELYLNTGTSKGVLLQKFGSGYAGTWGGQALANWTRLRTDSAAGGLILATGGYEDIVFGTADTERVRIGYYGGIWVRNIGGNGFYIDSPSDSGILVVSPGYDGVYVYNPGNNGIHVQYPSNNGVHVNDPGGNGLAVVYSSYTGKDGVLVTNGNIRVDNGSFIDSGVTLNVPDYVFEPDYPLMTLAELRTFVTAEKHLPGVPSQAEVKADGVDLGATNMLLLEKVEELTLYTLQQDEQLSSQQSQIAALQAQNADQQTVIVDLQARLAALERQTDAGK